MKKSKYPYRGFALLILGLLTSCSQKENTSNLNDEQAEKTPTGITIVYCGLNGNVLELIKIENSQSYQVKFNGRIAFEGSQCEKRDLLPELPFRESMAKEEVIFRNSECVAKFEVTSERQMGSHLSNAELSFVSEGKIFSFPTIDTVVFNENAWFSDLACTRLPPKEIFIADDNEGLKWPRESSSFTTAKASFAGFFEGSQFVNFDGDEGKTFECWDEGFIETYFDDYQVEGVALTQFKLKPEFQDKKLYVTWEIRESKDDETGEAYKVECLIKIELQ